MSAYGGWVVFSIPIDTTPAAWRLMAWHDGQLAALPVRPRLAPFDVDVGPDASGRVTAVYSRCLIEVARAAPLAALGCDLYGVALRGGRERRLAQSTSRHSEFAPAIWRGMLAFGRLSPRQRKADVFLSRRHTPLKRLGPGTLPHKGREAGDEPSRAWPEQLDLGARAVAYLWLLGGADVQGYSPALELRVARLDGSRSRIADNGWRGEGIFAEVFSPNVTGTQVAYGLAVGDYFSADSANSFRRFGLASARRVESRETGPGTLTSLAWDGRDVYWLRRNVALYICGNPMQPVCSQDLIRSHDLPFRRIRGGEASPPLI